MSFWNSRYIHPRKTQLRYLPQSCQITLNLLLNSPIEEEPRGKEKPDKGYGIEQEDLGPS